jgi:hypothetical protein
MFPFGAFRAPSCRYPGLCSVCAARPGITVLPTGAPGDRMPCTLHREPVPAQQQHVDVNVFAARPPRRQLDGVPHR